MGGMGVVYLGQLYELACVGNLEVFQYGFNTCCPAYLERGCQSSPLVYELFVACCLLE